MGICFSLALNSMNRFQKISVAAMILLLTSSYMKSLMARKSFLTSFGTLCLCRRFWSCLSVPFRQNEFFLNKLFMIIYSVQMAAINNNKMICVPDWGTTTNVCQSLHFGTTPCSLPRGVLDYISPSWALLALSLVDLHWIELVVACHHQQLDCTIRYVQWCQ